ncbi:hypothetical protein [Donghicola tyrosinivorans]|uniref:Lipoprotein n=1 Tax=Donghicola tyrosinivorans TaxID=1652492 RepID=A0A2T0WX50_9RHOB|nr:hypothetical protein [Donghicola tyrosinivorans]MEC9199128.1 hypothetical protein [Pseudomonadota bacterium]MEE3070326.1 hypothetical protein [Pseudomonadota bacterium]PRY91237.1 hypothetical protein CLV74_104258 [Donghicola tyrosinivorans]
MRVLSATLLIAALAVSACGKQPYEYAGSNHKAKVKTARSDRATMTIPTKKVSDGLDGARAAAQFEATRHCLKYFGSSDIIWAVGPETADADLPINGEVVTFSGVCAE